MNHLEPFVESIAAQGWPVFPCTKEKTPYTDKGFYDASNDERQIREWWGKWPDANIGVPTGKESGFFVLDIDLPDGRENIKKITDKYGPLPETLQARTGSGGTHFFFKHIPGIKNSSSKIAPKIDVRGDGGYVLVPPSKNIRGSYKWINDSPIEAAPGWLVDLILSKQTKATRINDSGRPGDGFESRGDIRPILEKHGWQFFQDSGTGERWTRPGKDTGTSATIFDDGSLYVFSGNAAPFEAETRYKKFAVYALLEHAGDYKAAAKALLNEGYGEEQTIKAYRHTELGNAERFADQHRDYVRYVTAWKKWIFYDQKRWQVGAHEKIRRFAQDTAKGLYFEAAKADDQDLAAKIAKWANTSCRSAALTAMLKEASALLAIEPDKLDADPWLFNCNNCTINLKTGLVQPHSRSDFITKITPVDFLPEAKAPTFIKVIHACLDPDLIDFVQRFFGYCMSGSTKEQVIIICYGTGQNGKSTVINSLSKALGDYAQTTRPETLMIKYNNQNTSDLAKLKGARLVTAAEAEDGQRLAESAIKQMTGGEKIQARAMYADWFEFTPEFKIILCTNHKPIIRGTDYAIWRRIRLIPWVVTIPEDEQDKELPEKLQKELPGILRWIVEGAAKWLQSGLETPEKIKMATQEYQSEQNIIRNFLECECIEKPGVFVGATDLFKGFDVWRTDEGQRKITQTKFGRMLQEMGYQKTRSSVGRMIYAGIGLYRDQNNDDLGSNPSDYSKNRSNYSEDLIQ